MEDTLPRLRQEDLAGFKASLSYLPRTCLIKENPYKAAAREFWR